MFSLFVPQLSESNDSSQPLIDRETFNQILDLDEDDSHDFSKGMAWAFFTQAESTFQDMDLALYAFPFLLYPFSSLILPPGMPRTLQNFPLSVISSKVHLLPSV